MKQQQIQQKQQVQKKERVYLNKPGLSESDSQHPVLQAQNIIGNHGVLNCCDKVIQAKLRVGAPDDKYEREAYQVADKLMRKEAQKQERVSIHSIVSQQSAADKDAIYLDLQNRLNRSKGKGSPISEELRTIYEPIMQFNMGTVRIHTDNQSAQLNQELGSLAFTHGQDIFFGNGLFDPQSNKGRRLLVHELTHVVQQSGDSSHQLVQRDIKVGTDHEKQSALDTNKQDMTWSEMFAEAFMTNPRLMIIQAKEYYDDIGPILSKMHPGDPFFSRTYNVYWGFFSLIISLKQMQEGENTTQEQRKQVNDLAQRWNHIQIDIEAHNKREAKRNLKKARTAVNHLRIELLYAYRDIYNAGQKPEDVKVGSGNMKKLVEDTTDLLKAINEADASISGRSVTPLIPVLEKTLNVVKLITSWKVTSDLASECESDMAAIQNTLSLSTTVLGLAGFGKFLPFFSHIGPLLDGIAKGLTRIVKQLQEKNRMWWELREIMGEDPPHPIAMPGPSNLITYMKSVFRASKPLPGRPPNDIVKFFGKNIEMFNKVNAEVMDKGWSQISTKSSWIFWNKVDPDALNTWVYYNRNMVWHVIYGRGWNTPNN